MVNLSIVEGLFTLGTLGLILHILYLHLWQRTRLLEQQLQLQQQLMEQAFTNIHNGSMQMLAFLIKEIEIHEVTQEELLEYLREVYQKTLADVQNLKQ